MNFTMEYVQSLFNQMRYRGQVKPYQRHGSGLARLAIPGKTYPIEHSGRVLGSCTAQEGFYEVVVGNRTTFILTPAQYQQTCREVPDGKQTDGYYRVTFKGSCEAVCYRGVPFTLGDEISGSEVRSGDYLILSPGEQLLERSEYWTLPGDLFNQMWVRKQ